MDGETAFVATVAIISGVALIVGPLALWFDYRKKRMVGPGSLRSVEDRLTRMEQAIDTIAIEVERVSEGVRFTSKVLAERSDRDRASALPSAEKSERRSS